MNANAEDLRTAVEVLMWVMGGGAALFLTLIVALWQTKPDRAEVMSIKEEAQNEVREEIRQIMIEQRDERRREIENAFRPVTDAQAKAERYQEERHTQNRSHIARLEGNQSRIEGKLDDMAAQINQMIGLLRAGRTLSNVKWENDKS